MTLSEKDWKNLIFIIRQGRCIPFLGAGASTPYLPTSKDLANTLSVEYEYPIDDTYTLSSVTEYISIITDKEFPKKRICEKLKDYNIRDQKGFVNYFYSIFSNFDFPVYVTTNYDRLLEEALKTRGRIPDIEYCRWNEELKIDKSIFEDSEYKPSISKPLVYHLHGLIDNPSSLVITESDYIDFLDAFLDIDQLIPVQVRNPFASGNYLFIGYSLKDTNVRLMIKKLIRRINMGFAVFLPFTIKDEELKVKAHQYYEEYFLKNFRTKIFWGTAEKFIVELYDRFQKYDIQYNKKEKVTQLTRINHSKKIWYNSDGQPISKDL